ncbi:hypothetical protein Tco_0241659 [Tanacetum coccineum]
MKNDDLKQVDVTMTKPSIEEPPELELKDLPSHLEYAFLEGTDKLPIIISQELKEEERATLLKLHRMAHFIDYRKLNDVTRKDHFPLPFIDQMLKRLAGKLKHRLLLGMDFPDIFKFRLTLKTRRRPPSLALMGRLLTDVCLSAYVMLRARSKGV